MSKIYLTTLLLFISTINVFSQSSLTNKEIKFDKSIKKGILNTGLTYYIKENKAEENSVCFYLVQKCGAIVENDDENGLAHFLEHMLFNGTKHFPKNEIHSYLKKYGVENINATTSINEIYYYISNVPAKKNLIDSCLLILKDWCNDATLSQEDIDMEKPIIIEEWRRGRNLQKRIYDKSMSVVYNNSKYAKRDVIGDTAIIKGLKTDKLEKFYNKWYVPSNLALIVVGDIKAKDIEEIIRNKFSGFTGERNDIPTYLISDNNTPMFEEIEDNEIKRNSIIFRNRFKVSAENNYKVSSVREGYIDMLFNTMVATKINLIMHKTQTSFLSASMSIAPMVKGYGSLNISASFKKDEDESGLVQLLEMVNKILKGGFTDEEFSDALDNLKAMMEKYYAAKDYIANDNIAMACKNHFVYDVPYMTPKDNYKIFNKVIKSINKEDITDRAKQLCSVSNNLSVTYLKNEHLTAVPFDRIMEIYKQADNKNYNDITEKSEKPLKFFDYEVEEGQIVKEEKIKNIDAEKWTLSNGATVIYKNTYNNSRSIKLLCTAEGGLNSVTDENYSAAVIINRIINSFGVGKNTAVDLKNLLKDKSLSVVPYIDQKESKIEGVCLKEDFEEMMQLMYMYFEKPRFDKEIFDIVVDRTINSLDAQKEKSLAEKLQDSVTLITNSYDPKINLDIKDIIKKVKFDKLEEVYMSKFNGANNFTFYIVGDVRKSLVKDYVSKYIASLKTSGYKGNSVKLENKFPQGITNKVLKFDMEEPKAGNIIIYQNEVETSIKNEYLLNITAALLKEDLNRIVREEYGGTYAIFVTGSIDENLYSLNIQFECNPQRAVELNELTNKIVADLVKNGISDAVFNRKYKVKRPNSNGEEIKRTKEEWMGILKTYIKDGIDLTSAENTYDILENLKANDFNEFIRNYFTKVNKVNLVYLPK